MALLRRRTPGSKPPAAARRRPVLEIQYHPADIRRGVRYIFLTRRQIVGWVAAALAYLAFLVFGVLSVPTVLAKRQYEELQLVRTQEGERLKEILEDLAKLETQSEQSLLEMSKIHLAYGLPDDSRGMGGYPHPEPDSASSPLEPGAPRWIYLTEIRRAGLLHGEIADHMEVLRVFLEEVHAFETANRDQVHTTPSLSPLRSDAYVMTSPFGTRRSPFTKEIDFHAGIDLAAESGTEIYAPADGVVTFASRFPLRKSVAWWRYGNLVAIKNGERFMTLYGHLEEIRVKVGEKVKQGQVIATVGSTGWSTNPHLHYEVRWRGEDGSWNPVDPRIYILDHHWRDEEKMLIQARKAPGSEDYEPLPPVIGR